MKQIHLIIVMIIFFCFNGTSQILCDLGNEIIEKNDFEYAKTLLNRFNYNFYPDELIRFGGSDPNIRAVGTKGTNPTNSIMVIVEAISLEDSGIKLVSFQCAKMYAIYLESTLRKAGYKYKNERNYLKDGLFNVNEKTYKRIIENSIDTAIITFFPDKSKIGSKIAFAIITFQRTWVKN